MDKLAEEQIIWVKIPNAIMKNPAPHLSRPIFDPCNIDVKLPESRPRGYVQVTRLVKDIADNSEFIKIGRAATCSILKSLSTRPLAVQEVQYKLNTDVDSNVLISLSDFLQQADVKSYGITQHNVHQYLAISGLLLVYNPQSQSSKV